MTLLRDSITPPVSFARRGNDVGHTPRMHPPTR